METIFDRILKILDYLDNSANGADQTARDQNVVARLDQLTASYNNLLGHNSQPIDYSSLETHLAYAFRCVGPHADLLYRTLAAGGATVKALFMNDVVKISCIGGGPGSDILGILKYIERFKSPTSKLEFTILDKEPEWKSVRCAIRKALGRTPKTLLRAPALDLSAGPNWTNDTAYKEANIFTFSFCLSEVWKFNSNGSVSGFLNDTIGSAAQGSVFVYCDNGGDSFTPKMEAVFGMRNDLKLLVSEEHNRGDSATKMLIGSDEQVSTIQAYKVRYLGQSPKLTGTVSRRLWVKI